MNKLKGIKLVAPFFDASGYAEWARSYALALIQHGVPVTLGIDKVRNTGRPITVEGVHPDLGEKGKILEQYVNKDIDYNVVIAWLTPNLALEQTKFESGVKKINFTLWETSSIPKSWCHWLAFFDEIWLPGEFNKGSFTSSFSVAAREDPAMEKLLKTPLRTFKYPLNLEDYQTSKTAKLSHPVTSVELSKNTYVFYAISQWTERKNFTDLIEAYWSVFNDTDDVVLYLKTYKNNYSEVEHQWIQNYIKNLASGTGKSNLPPIGIIRQLLSKQQIYALHKACDCYVSSARGEGLGLGLLNAGLFGNPVITHSFGEQSTYINNERGFIYNHTLRPVTRQGGWYSIEQYWANPDVQDLAKMMLYAYNNQAEAKRTGEKLRDYLVESCDYGAVAESMVLALEESL